MSETKEINIFDIIKSINQKNYMFDDTMSGKLYNKFIVNTAFGNSKDSVFIAGVANQYPNMTDKMNYDFYYYALPKAYRFGKWYKKSDYEDVQLVMDVYNLSYSKAVDVAALLNEKQLKELEKKLFKGGIKNEQSD